MIHFKIAEIVLDDFYFCHNPGKDGKLYHLTDDCFIGYSIDFEKNELQLFNYNDCDFDTLVGAKYFNYEIPGNFETLVDLLQTHQLLFKNETPEIDKQQLVEKYSMLFNEHELRFYKMHNEIIQSKNITMYEQNLLLNALHTLYNDQFIKGFYECDIQKNLKSINKSNYRKFIKPILVS